MNYYEEIKRMASSSDSLQKAVELAIVGNVIDYGLRKSLDVGEELRRIVGGEGGGAGKENSSFFHYREFERALDTADTILYLADNAGEIVFDRVLIEEIKKFYPGKRITFAVKERPVINDSLMEDEIQWGINEIVNVRHAGSDAPGTILCHASTEFKKVFGEADMIISKGQGNYETLTEEEGPIFYLFMAKCEVVADYLGCSLEEIILLNNSHNNGILRDSRTR